MLCRKCGAKNDDKEYFCAQCGAALEDDGPADRPPGDEVVPPAQSSNPPQPRGFSDHSSYPEEISTNLFPAILVTIFCCMPFGVVAIAFAAIASNHIASHNREAAIQASESARTWCWRAFWCGLIIIIALLIFSSQGGHHF